MDQKLVEDLRNTFPIMWAEMLIFLAFTIGMIFCIGRAGPLLAGQCASSSLRIPYILAHASEVCGNHRLVRALSVYYVGSAAIAAIFQICYFHRRRSIRRVSRQVQAWILLIFGLTIFFVYSWLIGREGFVVSCLMASLIIPGVQFIISSVLLEPRSEGTLHIPSDDPRNID